MTHVSPNWTTYEGTDPLPISLRAALYGSGVANVCNLCNRCGMRVWSEDMLIHDKWHEWLSAQLRGKVDNIQEA